MKRTILAGLLAALCLGAGIAAAAFAAPARTASAQTTTRGHRQHKNLPAVRNDFVVHNLVSDQAGRADHVDPNLVNAWGLAALPTSPWWVADNGADVATVYDATGAAFPAGSPLVVKVPKSPTGLV